MPNDDKPKGDSEIPQLLQQISERQKATARAVADLAIGLNTEARVARDRHAETQGLILGLLSPSAKHEPERKRRDSSDESRKFPIPGGEEGDSVVLTKRTQKKAIRWVLLGLAAAALHVAQWFLHAFVHWPGGPGGGK